MRVFCVGEGPRSRALLQGRLAREHEPTSSNNGLYRGPYQMKKMCPKKFKRWDYPKESQAKYSLQGLKTGKVYLEKWKIPYFPLPTAEKPFLKLEGPGRQFSKVKFCFRTCHPHTLVNSGQQVFYIWILLRTTTTTETTKGTQATCGQAFSFPSL